MYASCILKLWGCVCAVWAVTFPVHVCVNVLCLCPSFSIPFTHPAAVVPFLDKCTWIHCIGCMDALTLNSVCQSVKTQRTDTDCITQVTSAASHPKLWSPCLKYTLTEVSTQQLPNPMISAGRSFSKSYCTYLLASASSIIDGCGSALLHAASTSMVSKQMKS